MLRALRDGAGFFAWSEGHLFSALPPLLSGIRFHLQSYADSKADARGEYAINHLDVYRALNAFTGAFDHAYSAATRKSAALRWADKTPDAALLLAVPLLARIYPNGRFIFLHRHPLKLIRSRLKKFPTSPIESGINAWAATMEIWRELKPLLPASAYIEIAQEQMLSSPASVVDQLRHPLGLTDREVAGMVDYLQRERPEATSSGEDADVFLEDFDWPGVIKAWFITMCQPAAKAYGYRTQRSEALL